MPLFLSVVLKSNMKIVMIGYFSFYCHLLVVIHPFTTSCEKKNVDYKHSISLDIGIFTI